MGISHAEFRRSLAPLGRHYPYTVYPSGRRVRMAGKTAAIEIRLGDERRHRLGSLELPQTTVELRFLTSDKREIEQFLSRFDLCFQRGGG